MQNNQGSTKALYRKAVHKNRLNKRCVFTKYLYLTN